jgi:hypothetical protein
MENWIEIKGYNGKYLISDLGNVKTKHKNGTETIKKGYISKTNQYYKIGLYSNGKTKNYEVHKLVAMCFLNHTPNGLKLVVDHKDNNKLNNKVCNLQIVTQRLNTQKNRINANKILGIKKKPSGRFEASIKINGKKVYLGLFETDLKAGAIYQKANNSLSSYENPKQFREFLQIW